MKDKVSKRARERGRGAFRRRPPERDCETSSHRRSLSAVHATTTPRQQAGGDERSHSLGGRALLVRHRVRWREREKMERGREEREEREKVKKKGVVRAAKKIRKASAGERRRRRRRRPLSRLSPSPFSFSYSLHLLPETKASMFSLSPTVRKKE